MDDIIGIFISDIHLGHAVPAARGENQEEWYSAMGRMLEQVVEVWESTGATVFCAGDVFDKWYVYPELINWAIRNLPPMVAVPGQHDLPTHNRRLLNKSAFYTLMKAGVITYWPRKRSWVQGDFQVHAFPWGRKVVAAQKRIEGKIQLALIHSYIWKKGCEYSGAPDKASLNEWKNRVASYDLAVFGDNHKGFLVRTGLGNIILNCGCLIRRKSHEREYNPCLGILRRDGSVARRNLDATKDKWVESSVSEPMVKFADGSMDDLIKELSRVKTDSIVFQDALWRYVRKNKVKPSVVQKLHGYLENKK